MIQKITKFKFSGISELHIKDCNLINYVKLSINVGITKVEIMSFFFFFKILFYFIFFIIENVVLFYNLRLVSEISYFPQK